MWFLTWWLRVVAIFGLIFPPFVRITTNFVVIDFNVVIAQSILNTAEYRLLLTSSMTKTNKFSCDITNLAFKLSTK